VVVDLAQTPAVALLEAAVEVLTLDHTQQLAVAVEPHGTAAIICQVVQVAEHARVTLL
jgi:hypothetical protein